MENLRLLIVDDHDLFRAGLAMILEQDPRIAKILQAGSVMAAKRLGDEAIDLIFLDIEMPGLNGLDGMKVLQEKFSPAPVLILSGGSDEATIERAERLGAMGFLSKSAAAEDISFAIERVLQGQRCFPDDMRGGDGPSQDENEDTLTPRQLEVLALLCEGKTNKGIAKSLSMSENTARVHVSTILAKLRVSSRSEAILAAQRSGIIRLV